MTRAGLILSIQCLVALSSPAQLLKTYKFNSLPQSPFPKSNVVNDILVQRDSIWFATEKGLTLTINNGSGWLNFANTLTFDEKGISALAVRGSTIWAATAYTVNQGGESLPSGGGLHYSMDGGQTWAYIPEPVDVGTVDTLQYGVSKIKALAVTTTVNNLAYDISLTNGTVWIACFAAMLRKSTDLGMTWQRVILPPDGPPNFISPGDSLDFDLAPTAGRLGLRGNLNHRVFSVFASSDSVLWVGTAGGINKSTDGGVSWRRFSHQDQTNPISGNFVVAIGEQRWQGRSVLWAATVNAESADEVKGVSFSDDGGNNWKTALLGHFAHNFAFKDSIAYVATDDGLFRSSDGGTSWTLSGIVYDPSSSQRFTSAAIFAVGTKGDTVWVGGGDGTAYTFDTPSQPFGSTWRIFRTYEPVSGLSRTYSYPNPFSPNSEAVRVHYAVNGSGAARDVTVRVFDFAMQPVRLLIQHASRLASKEYDEIWDGKDDRGQRVANGVYFYRVEIQDSEVLWGKIFVLQ